MERVSGLCVEGLRASFNGPEKFCYSPRPALLHRPFALHVIPCRGVCARASPLNFACLHPYFGSFAFVFLLDFRESSELAKD